MGRLIDADSKETIENIVFVICKDFDTLNREYVRISVEEALERTKTAFDRDKVMLILAEKMKRSLDADGDTKVGAAFAEAIAIVKKGGISE